MDRFDSRVILEVVHWLWTGWDGKTRALVILTAVEALSSMLLAVCQRRCRGCLRATARILMMFLVIGAARAVDDGMGGGGLLRTLAGGYYLAYEGGRILEAAEGLGLPVPRVLKGFLQNQRGDGGG